MTPDLIVRAYCQGYFPMACGRDGEVSWYNPDPRAILPLDGLRVPRSLRKRIRSGWYHVTFDEAFAQVIEGCAGPRPTGDDTWISEEIIEVYTALHDMGIAHSVEAWRTEDGQGQSTLVGGLYGLGIGSAFFGESMFSAATDASKVCLVHLVERLRAHGYTLLDTQLTNPHMEQFGVVEVPQAEYLAVLAEAVAARDCWREAV